MKIVLFHMKFATLQYKFLYRVKSNYYLLYSIYSLILNFIISSITSEIVILFIYEILPLLINTAIHL